MSNFDEQVLLRLETLERKVDAIARNVAAEPRAHCLTKNVTEQLPASNWGGDTESGRCRRWREESACERGARWCWLWPSATSRQSDRPRGASSTSYARRRVGIASMRCGHFGNTKLSQKRTPEHRESASADTARRSRMR